MSRTRRWSTGWARSPLALAFLLGIAGLLLAPAFYAAPGVRGPPSPPLGREAAAIPLELRGADALSVASFEVAPASVAVGQIVYFNVTATGGSPPYSYHFTALPLGCYDRNATSDPCGVAEAGHFHPGVTVNDSAGGSVNATTSLTVVTGYGGPPVITSFYADPTTAAAFQKVVIYGNAASSSTVPTASLTYLYLDLPPGCASFNSTVLECIPTGGGSFHIRLQVSDAFGAFAVKTTWLNITGGSAPTSTPANALLGSAGIIVGVVVLAAIVAAILLLRPGRRPRRPTPARPWSP